MSGEHLRTVAVDNVHRTYGSGDAAVRALRGVTATIWQGEVVALMGPSGSGKTTLLNCLLGLDKPDAGSITVFGETVNTMSYEDAVTWRRRNIAIVFQTTGLLPHLTARENVDIVLRIRNVSRADRDERIAKSFESMQISSFADHRPQELSGGQRQRVSLARAIATRPSLLVADEPTGELDSETTAIVLEELRSAAKQHGTTMLLATHDQDVQAVSDRTLHMADGRTADPRGNS